MDKSFETILDEAGITDFRFHDLRHTFASWYMMNGGDLYELAKILGHSNIRMTERYSHREDRGHGTRDVETDGRRERQRVERSSLNVRLLFDEVKSDVPGQNQVV